LAHEAAEHGLRQCRHEAAQTARPSLSFAPALVVDSALVVDPAMPRYADIPDKTAQRLQAKFFASQALSAQMVRMSTPPDRHRLIGLKRRDAWRENGLGCLPVCKFVASRGKTSLALQNHAEN